MEDNSRTIKLTGSASFTTPDPKEVFTVTDGEANVYIQFNEGEMIDRSLFLRDVSKGDKVPGLACLLPGSENKWHFVIIPKKTVTLERSYSDDANSRLGNEFADSIEGFPESDETDYQKRFVRWYIEVLRQETASIHKMREQKEKDINSNLDLMESLFKNKRILNYEFSTDSILYNTVSVLCDYMNIL